MESKTIWNRLVILSLLSLLFYLSTTSARAVNIFEWFGKKNEVQQFTKDKQPQKKVVQCNRCPSNCLIKPDEKGDCGQYKNINGKLVPVN